MFPEPNTKTFQPTKTPTSQTCDRKLFFYRRELQSWLRTLGSYAFERFTLVFLCVSSAFPCGFMGFQKVMFLTYYLATVVWLHLLNQIAGLCRNFLGNHRIIQCSQATRREARIFLMSLMPKRWCFSFSGKRAPRCFQKTYVMFSSV